MPLPPLPEPPRRGDRVRALSKAVPATGVLFGSLLAINAVQTLSLGLKLVSPGSFRRFNRFAADTWWGWCVTGSQKMNDSHIVVTGDPVPMRENAIVVANHQQMPDITFLMMWARQKDRLGDLKWIVKDVIKYVPGVGWGMAFIDCVFVKRDWAADRKSIERAFARLTDNQVPMWLVSFPEATRITPEKVARSRAYAETAGLPPPEHVLIPRTKGFVASVHGLRRHVTAVYDVTIGYEEGVPTLWQFVKGYAKRAHLHVRRYPIADLPADDDALAAWLQARFHEKDALLAHFYREGAFPAGGAAAAP
ncbi:MAG TPA: lysophospholipid acyltransferase family protein [Polyangia bacterium]|jgi:1-acyl-sn-glycerol-3-phosphate acyltransferase